MKQSYKGLPVCNSTNCFKVGEIYNCESIPCFGNVVFCKKGVHKNCNALLDFNNICFITGNAFYHYYGYQYADIKYFEAEIFEEELVSKLRLLREIPYKGIGQKTNGRIQYDDKDRLIKYEVPNNRYDLNKLRDEMSNNKIDGDIHIEKFNDIHYYKYNDFIHNRESNELDSLTTHIVFNNKRKQIEIYNYNIFGKFKDVVILDLIDIKNMMLYIDYLLGEELKWQKKLL